MRKNNEALSGVYIIENSYNGRLYVGSSKNIGRRFRGHLNALRSGKHRNSHLQSAFLLYGEAAFLFVLVEKTENLLPREQYYMDYLKPMYNICPKAASPANRTHSIESRRNMSAAHRGKRKPLSAEHRQNLSAVRRGRPLSEQHRASIVAAAALRKGKPCKPFSPEHCQRISAAKIKKSVERISDAGEIQTYPSISSTKDEGFAPPAVWSCCTGRYKSHKGYQWRYAALR